MRFDLYERQRMGRSPIWFTSLMPKAAEDVPTPLVDDVRRATVTNISGRGFSQDLPLDLELLILFAQSRKFIALGGS